MAQLKKFMFDNFVIPTKQEEQQLEDIEEDAFDVVEAESIEQEKVSLVELVPEPEPEPEVIPEPEEIIIEPEEEDEFVPEEKTYLQSEVDEMVDAAKQEGYDEGMKTSQNNMTAEENSLLNDISQKLTLLLSDVSAYQKEIENQAMKMVQAVVSKLVPTLQEEQATNLVNKFIADNFNNFKDEAKLSFYIHPDIISYVQEKIASLANSYDFEGKISLHKDVSLAKNDCRIEWENGGVELNGTDNLKKVNSLLTGGEEMKPEIKA